MENTVTQEHIDYLLSKIAEVIQPYPAKLWRYTSGR